MQPLDSKIIDWMWMDWAHREERIREIVTDRLKSSPPPRIEDAIVASYFFAFRTQKLEEAVKEISYHATIGIKNPPPGSLLEACAAKGVGVDSFDSTGRLGILHVAYPLKMMAQADGHVTSTDILHTAAGAIIFDTYETLDARLVRLTLPDKIVRSFPGPAYGPQGVRWVTNFGPVQPAFGTILKPTAGITPEQVGELIGEIASCKLFLFVKEDEDLYPNLDYTPVAQRTRKAMAAIEAQKDKRGELGLLFAPHITGAPHEILDSVHAVLEAGAKGVMFNESFSNGTVRLVRETTKFLKQPPAIYGHNAGIGTRTKTIWREVIDYLARLDGIDFRQTAPVKPGMPFLLPYGQEWTASEEILTRSLPGIKPTMIVRAGGLDQGNIGLNMADVEQRGIMGSVLFLAGSAINSVKNSSGKPDPQFGAEAMMQAIEVHRSGVIKDASMDQHLPALKDVSERQSLKALREALRQRYPKECA